MGELRRHRGRLHRLPRAQRTSAAAVPVAPRREAPAQPLPLPRLHDGDWNLRVVLRRLWGDQPLSYRSWAVQPSRSRSSASSGAGATSTCSSCRSRSTSRRSAATSASTGGARVSVARLAATAPFKGLAPFEDSELDALLFFGRERERERDRREPARRAAHRPLRRERRRQELAAARRRRAPTALPAEPDAEVVVLSSLDGRRGRRRCDGLLDGGCRHGRSETSTSSSTSSRSTSSTTATSERRGARSRSSCPSCCARLARERADLAARGRARPLDAFKARHPEPCSRTTCGSTHLDRHGGARGDRRPGRALERARPASAVEIEPELVEAVSTRSPASGSEPAASRRRSSSS